MRWPELAFLIGLVFPVFATAQTWTSPDGFLTVRPPADFQAVPMPPAPFIGLWVSDDGSMRFGVLKTPIPPGVSMIQSAVEEGLAEEIGGKVKRLPTTTIDGHEVWKMTATGESAEITQATIRHEHSFYKVMAATVGSEPEAGAVTRFIDSLSITQPSQHSAAPANRSEAEPRRDQGGIDLHDASKAIGGAGALLGIAIAIYLLARARRQPK